MTAPKLIVFTGLPGTGKSTMADYVSRQFGIPVIAKDWLEAALWRGGVGADKNSGSIAYDLMTSLADEQLARGVSVLLDSVAVSDSIRKTWADLAEKHAARLLAVECICSDEAVHRQRLGVRKRGIDGWPELTWENVLEVKSRYHTWDKERLVLDAMDTIEKNTSKLVEYLAGQ